MRLEAVTAELRPRNDWEAIDLGLALVRRDFWKLGAAWWLGMLPALAGATALLLTGHPFWAGILFWWWIPVASRLVLFRLSRRLFGDDPGRGELWREFPRAVGRRFFYRMTWARFSPMRPLTMPVEDLEGLRGKAYTDRVRVLTRRGDSSVMVLALWRIFLSFWVAVALFFTAMLFVPEHSAEAWNETLRLWWEGDVAAPPTSLALSLMAAFALSMWLVDMFSTGAGFGIYVNHRTWVEGWDVELAFRRLANRLRTAGVAALLLWVSWSGAGALHAREEGAAGEVIKEVLADEDFIVHRKTIKEPEPWNWDWLANLFGGGGGGGAMSAMAELLLVLVVGAVVGTAIWLIYRNRHVFRSKGMRGAGRKIGQASVVMGMEVTPESLPDDVAAEALSLWRAGRRQEAMGLLYRGSISWMIRRGGVEIAESDTESDCLGRVREAGVAHGDYFDRLTGHWLRLAYAREAPADGEVEGLCERWPFGEGGTA